jgi:glycosyltransferase involved in cell wall biosynthesis
MPELQAFLAQQPHLVPHVHFRGRVAHERMEAVFNSADFLLQASDREYSGFAVVEAMACGTIPVVTDIPAFRALTSAGRYGILFPRGDSGALARQVLAIDLASIPARAVATRRHFEREFSFATMARRLVAVYREVQREQREVA